MNLRLDMGYFELGGLPNLGGGANVTDLILP